MKVDSKLCAFFTICYCKFPSNVMTLSRTTTVVDKAGIKKINSRHTVIMYYVKKRTSTDDPVQKDNIEKNTRNMKVVLHEQVKINTKQRHKIITYSYATCHNLSFELYSLEYTYFLLILP